MEEDILTVYKSVRNHKWVQRSYDSYLVESVRRLTSLPDLVSQILSKHINSPEMAFDYLNPKLKNLLPNPFVFKDMDKAVEIVLSAINDSKKIVIFGDYDVDGATSAALIKNVFKLYGVEVGIYVPDRILEGYGLNNLAVESLKNSGYDLIITVDCGASSHSEIKYAKELGLDVVVLDHHKCSEILPCADAVVNPNRMDEDHSYYYLAAVGVAFLFLLALHSEFKKKRPELGEINLLRFLDLVALGTVCDVVPLVGLNRAFVRQGIKVMNSKENICINALMAIAGINDEISPYHLGYVLGPRINAGGRVGRSDLGATLLSMDDEEVAISIAAQLDIYNNERKAIEISVLEAAKRQAESLDKSLPVLVLTGEGWHQGVRGIVAGRLKDLFGKPVAVIALENGVGKGSCRSIEGIDFGSAIISAREKGILVAGGGHAMAAGFTINEENIEGLREFLCKSFSESFVTIKENYVSHYAASLAASSLDLSLVKHVENLGPFGSGNAQPRFMLHNVVVLNPKVLKDSHVSCLLIGDKNRMNRGGGVRAIAFSVMQSSIGEVLLSSRGPLHMIVTLDINKWQGSENVQVVIHDVIVT